MATSYPQSTWREALARSGGLLAIVALIAWAWAGTGFDPTMLIAGCEIVCMPKITGFDDNRNHL